MRRLFAGPAAITLRLPPCASMGAVADVVRQCRRVTPEALVLLLPALGNVLYVPMPSSEAQRLSMSGGVLVEAMPLAPLLRTSWVMLASVITVEGPREWMDVVDHDCRICARLHLLPDTDYLAWDALSGCGQMVQRVPVVRSATLAHPASAQLLRFHGSRLAGWQVIGARLASTTSTLSRNLARRIARDDAVPLELADQA